METTAVNETTQEKKVSKTGTMPVKQADILTLTESVVKKWEATPTITLQWVKIDEFKSLAEQLKTSLEQRIDAGSGRQSKTQLLSNLDKALNQAIEQTKISILGKFGKNNGKAYFSEFGIQKVGTSLKLPTDRNQRLQAIDTLIKGLEKHQLSITDYPMAFFKDTQKQYSELMSETKDIDSNVSSEVGTKNKLIKQVSKILNALILIIKGNYPDTYKSELRAWGFQKEKY